MGAKTWSVSENAGAQAERIACSWDYLIQNQSVLLEKATGGARLLVQAVPGQDLELNGLKDQNRRDERLVLPGAQPGGNVYPRFRAG